MDIWCAVIVVCLPVILAAGCDDDWKENNGMCYYFSNNEKQSRNNAQARCKSMSGVLASASTKDINNELHSRINNASGDGDKHHWIGLYGEGDSHYVTEWHWVNGMNTSTLEDVQWDAGSPNQTVCGSIRNKTQLFGNKECGANYKYICESETSENATWESFNGHWYLHIHHNKKFLLAMNSCLRLNAYLAVIDNLAELNHLRSMMKDDSYYWIGLTTLHWLDNSPIFWSNFKDGEDHKMNDSNPCVHLHTSNKWEIADCATELRFICQKPKQSTSISPSKPTITSLMITKSTTETASLQQTDSIKDTDYTQSITNEVPTNQDRKMEKSKMKGDEDIPMIVGVVAGIMVLMIVVVVVILLLYRRRKRSNSKPYEGENFGTSDFIDSDIQPYGTSEIQPYVTSDIKTIEDNNLNHKYEDNGASPYYNEISFKEENPASVCSNVQELPMYAFVSKPKGQTGPSTTNDMLEHQSKLTGKVTVSDSESNVNSMPVYAIVDVAKKQAANAKEKSVQQTKSVSSKNANESFVETNKDDKLAGNGLPVYAVVDKTTKKAANVEKQNNDKQEQQEKYNFNPTNAQNNAPVYAVVDKTKKVQSSKPTPPVKPSVTPSQYTDVDTSAHIYSDCENDGPSQIQYSELDFQDEQAETNKFSFNIGHDYAEVQFKD